MFFLFPLFAVLIWSVNAIVNKLSASAIEPAAISFIAGYWRCWS
ncbi:hypothetical protein BN1184_BE_01580 [Pantoea ananatis]|nr:hypothetical protein BN1184_BE_01580 [Pantoea ananatis]